MSNHNVTCVSCKTMLRPRKNDVCVHITRDNGEDYQLWQADLWECPDCGHQVLLGFGQKSWAQHYEVGFKGYKATANFTISGQQKGLS